MGCNSTPYGLASVLWTQDVEKRAHRLARQLQAGIVWVNCWMVRDLRTPFGGMKSSGVGRRAGSRRCASSPRRRTSACGSEGSVHRVAVLHPIGEEPAETVIEPELEALGAFPGRRAKRAIPKQVCRDNTQPRPVRMPGRKRRTLMSEVR